MKKFFLPIVALLLIGVSFAHQPRLVFKQPVWEIVTVEKPEISQAFYGNLSGQEDLYEINADESFLMYVNIVVPNLPGYRTDYTVEIIESNYEIYTRLEGKSFEWEKFFERFAGDDYLRWPSWEQQVKPGKYTIKVSNPGNQGKYSLAIGKIESFPLGEMINTYRDMPALKMQFFQKPRYSIFWNLVGLSLILIIILLIVLTIWAIKLVKHYRHR